MNISSNEAEELAIAYLLGQANSEQVATYRRLFATDNNFRNVVREIEIWLAPLNEGVEEKTAPEGLLDNILADIADDQKQPSPLLVAANDRGAGKWKAIAAVASAIAIFSIGSHFVQLQEDDAPNETSALMALLSDSSQPELMAIVYEPNTGRVVARLSNINVPDGNDLQLWLIREGQPAPLSLGVLKDAGSAEQIEFSLPALLRSGTDTLAISLEAKGGSASDGPEGPVLFTGAVSALSQNL